MNSFNLINCQNYGRYDAKKIPAGYTGLVAFGLLAGNSYTHQPGYKGAFDWAFPDDIADGYTTTRSIAAAVGYPPKVDS